MLYYNEASLIEGLRRDTKKLICCVNIKKYLLWKRIIDFIPGFTDIGFISSFFCLFGIAYDCKFRPRLRIRIWFLEYGQIWIRIWSEYQFKNPLKSNFSCSIYLPKLKYSIRVVFQGSDPIRFFVLEGRNRIQVKSSGSATLGSTIRRCL